MKEINELFYFWYYCRAKPSLLDVEPSKHSIFLLAISLEIIMMTITELKKGKERTFRLSYWPIMVKLQKGTSLAGEKMAVSYQLTAGHDSNQGLAEEQVRT